VPRTKPAAKTEKLPTEEPLAPPKPRAKRRTPSDVEGLPKDQEAPETDATPRVTVPVEEEMTQPDPIPTLPASPPPPTPPAYPTRPLSSSDERTWAMLAHLSVLANLVSGILGVVAAIAIYLVFKDRSKYVAYHSLQSFVFQLIWWVGGGALAAFAWAVSGVLAAILVGCCLMPFALIISFVPIGALIYGVIGAIQTSQGLDFKYWLVGDWVRGTLENS